MSVAQTISNYHTLPENLDGLLEDCEDTCIGKTIAENFVVEFSFSDGSKIMVDIQNECVDHIKEP